MFLHFLKIANIQIMFESVEVYLNKYLVYSNFIPMRRKRIIPNTTE